MSSTGLALALQLEVTLFTLVYSSLITTSSEHPLCPVSGQALVPMDGCSLPSSAPQ